MYLFKFLFLVFLGIKPGVELLVQMVVLFVSFWRKLHDVFHCNLYQFTFSLTVYKGSLFFSSSQAFVISLSFFFFIINITGKCEGMSHCGFALHFPGD